MFLYILTLQQIMKKSQQVKNPDEPKKSLKILTETLKNRLDENQNPTSQSEASYYSSDEAPKRKKRKNGEKMPKTEKKKRKESEKGKTFNLTLFIFLVLAKTA